MASSSTSPSTAALILAIGLALSVSSCISPPPPPAAVVPDQGKSFWTGDGVPGKPKILISLSDQRLLYYKGGQLVGESPISSGREGHGTTQGVFRISEKDYDHRSSLYGAFCDAEGNIVVEDVDSRRDTPPPGTHYVGAPMRCFMRINKGIGMHEGYLPGYPASHGCIRLPGHMAEIFFNETPLGTPVEITGRAPAAVVAAEIVVEQKEVQAKKQRKPAMIHTEKPGGSILGSEKKRRAAQPPRGQTLYLY